MTKHLKRPAPSWSADRQYELIQSAEVERRFSEDHRGTPQWFFDQIQYRKAFGSCFDLDVAADEWNAKCPRFFDEQHSAFDSRWDAESVWMNPPYSSILPWIERTLDGFNDGDFDQQVALLPVRGSPKWYQRYHRFFHVEFIPFRIDFDLPPGSPKRRPAPNEDSMLWTLERPLRNLARVGCFTSPRSS